VISTTGTSKTEELKGHKRRFPGLPANVLRIETRAPQLTPIKDDKYSSSIQTFERELAGDVVLRRRSSGGPIDVEIDLHC
jgi:hypothetical protein